MNLNAWKHGLSRDPVYAVWKQMRQRCCNPKHAGFHNYGGRGISVCAAWGDFQTFLADVGPRPEGATLERTNNDGDYAPGNCVWATRKQQGRNRRTNKLITIDGVTHTLTEWCEITGVQYRVAASRLRLSWHPKDALTLPSFKRTRWTNQLMET